MTLGVWSDDQQQCAIASPLLWSGGGPGLSPRAPHGGSCVPSVGVTVSVKGGAGAGGETILGRNDAVLGRSCVVPTGTGGHTQSEAGLLSPATCTLPLPTLSAGMQPAVRILPSDL